MATTSDEIIAEAKRNAGFQAVDDFVRSGMKIGIGSGSTIVSSIERIAQKYRSKELENLVCVPTSFQSRQLILEMGLPLGDLDTNPVLDVAIDGADECDAELNLIKGGGGCQTLEKLVASNSKKLVIVADYRKKSQNLGEQWKKGVPVEVIPAARVTVSNSLRELGGEPKLRMASQKAGPVVTDNGNFIIDVDFGLLSSETVKSLDVKINCLTGVLEHGLFVGMAVRAYFGMESGSVEILDRKQHQ
mmetsp:Transcript_751/g.1103  ORF Transcript_751/g.1103 Transcript_751/m.1103 type:complete len:246 (+) Transcript_751:70-807(+)|eukprot:CAMPEP_0201486266 /NCGR_PEP_ID=MMETSP0151_2-20130828/10334_1 /ASSEMBLY_ACC=CAM_ASM_000257 /TAXON_ID=200890 /ORGANISM="Paramoeba atlantica, Strain 621/1 / CCAP 1560/9" /LENGTH=245 /DNA_ID=CAMNT_0047870813 /DNA_START=71 /DNA_END=808 /DNA_ORIENTATION=-